MFREYYLIVYTVIVISRVRNKCDGNFMVDMSNLLWGVKRNRNEKLFISVLFFC